MKADTHTPWREVLRVMGLTVVVLLALPVIAGLIYFLRAALLVALIAAAAAALVAFAASPRFRSWLRYVGQPFVPYKGLSLATDVALAPGHVWARVSGTEASVGADDLMQAALGPVDAVDLPPVGRHVQAGDPVFRLHHGDRGLSGRAPLTGTVLAVNESLREEPGLVNGAPFAGGWVLRLAADNLRRERDGLRRGTAARELFRREVDRLLGLVAAAEGVPALADGGEVVAEIHRHIDDATWTRVRKMVFAEPGALSLLE
jgi:glycine cleavage system H protein